MSDLADKVLDASGLCCPEPVMLLHKTIRGASSGDKIEVIATDPSTSRDIPSFCQHLGHKLLSNEEDSGTYRYLIEKG